MKAPNSQLVVDLNSVSYVSFYYKNQHGNARRTKPHKDTVRGMEIANPDELARAHKDYPNETMLERARRLEILDSWVAICKYQFRNNHSIHFEGEEAMKRKKQYDKHIFGK